MLLTFKVALRPVFGWVANQPLVLSFLYIFTDDPIYYYQGVALPLATPGKVPKTKKADLEGL